MTNVKVQFKPMEPFFELFLTCVGNLAPSLPFVIQGPFIWHLKNPAVVTYPRAPCCCKGAPPTGQIDQPYLINSIFWPTDHCSTLTLSPKKRWLPAAETFVIGGCFWSSAGLFVGLLSEGCVRHFSQFEGLPCLATSTHFWLALAPPLSPPPGKTHTHVLTSSQGLINTGPMLGQRQSTLAQHWVSGLYLEGISFWPTLWSYHHVKTTAYFIGTKLIATRIH